MFYYDNQNIIKEAFRKGELIVFKQGKKNVGLVIWSRCDDLQANIDIFVIHPDYRNQGLGKFYYNEILDFFRSKGLKMIKLFCYPVTSEKFWKKIGLIKLPKCGRKEDRIYYYSILVDTASIENTKDTKDTKNTNKIELWDVESDEKNEKKPKWTWYVEIKDGKLKYPIIHPCDCNWNLCWSRNGTIIKQEKVKYFSEEDELYYKPFLYIDNLQE